ncbi:MAG: gene transfer agent family protein [Hyphomicrobiaceae bacterium]
MANKRRGEIEARLDGKTFRLCLTLGALAELEAAFGDEDMLALATRFESGRLRAQDAVRIIGAGLRGAGYDIADEAVAQMQCDGAAGGYVGVVAELLQTTFGTTADDQNAHIAKTTDAPSEGHHDVPFPGTT